MNVFEILTSQKCREIFGKHGVVLAYLFGSQARGTAGPMSDADVAVVFDTSRKETFKPLSSRESDVAHDLRTELGLGIDVDVIDLEKVKDPVLRHRAAIEGRVLIDTKPFLRSQLQFRILQDYEDTRHFREVQMKYRHEHIAAGTFGKLFLVRDKSKPYEPGGQNDDRKSL